MCRKPQKRTTSMSANRPSVPASRRKPPAFRPSAPPKDSERKSWTARIVLLVLCIVWTIPTIGLLVTSLRPEIDTQQSGWWTALFNPFSSDWTTQNYDQVLNNNGMFDSFVNSLVVALAIAHMPLSVSAAVGFIALLGQAVLNGVLVVALPVSENGVVPTR